MGSIVPISPQYHTFNMPFFLSASFSPIKKSNPFQKQLFPRFWKGFDICVADATVYGWLEEKEFRAGGYENSGWLLGGQRQQAIDILS